MCLTGEPVNYSVLICQAVTVVSSSTGPSGNYSDAKCFTAASREMLMQVGERHVEHLGKCLFNRWSEGCSGKLPGWGGCLLFS